MFKILILSNGHREDISGSLIAKQFPKSGYSVQTLPIVGTGKKYKKEKIKIIGKTKEYKKSEFCIELFSDVDFMRL